MSRLASPLLILALLAGGVLLLIATAVPGLRHRHVGDVTHSHRHDDVASDAESLVHTHDGVTHTHSHRDGWHVHITLFGYSLTLWEPGSNATETVKTPATKSGDRADARDGHPALLATSPVAAGWPMLFWIDAATVPARVAMIPKQPSAAFSHPTDETAASLLDAPPVPPPEAV